MLKPVDQQGDSVEKYFGLYANVPPSTLEPTLHKAAEEALKTKGVKPVSVKKEKPTKLVKPKKE